MRLLLRLNVTLDSTFVVTLHATTAIRLPFCYIFGCLFVKVWPPFCHIFGCLFVRVWLPFCYISVAFLLDLGYPFV